MDERSAMRAGKAEKERHEVFGRVDGLVMDSVMNRQLQRGRGTCHFPRPDYSIFFFFQVMKDGGG